MAIGFILAVANNGNFRIVHPRAPPTGANQAGPQVEDNRLRARRVKARSTDLVRKSGLRFRPSAKLYARPMEGRTYVRYCCSPRVDPTRRGGQSRSCHGMAPL